MAAVLIGTKPPAKKDDPTSLVVIRLVTATNGCVVCKPTGNTDMFDIEAYPDNTLYYRQCHHRIGHQCTPGEDRIGDDIYTLMSIYSGGQVAESVFVKTRWPADVPARLERSLETSDIIICPQSGQKFRRTSEKVHFFQVRELSLGKPYDVFEVMNETGGE